MCTVPFSAVSTPPGHVSATEHAMQAPHAHVQRWHYWYEAELVIRTIIWSDPTHVVTDHAGIIGPGGAE